MKKCLFCSEEIQNEALKCPHCGGLLTTGDDLDSRKPCTECGFPIPVNRGFCPKCGVIQIRRVSGREANTCPSCHSDRIEKISTAKKAGYVALLGVLAPAFKSVRSQFKCNSCGHKW